MYRLRRILPVDKGRDTGVLFKQVDEMVGVVNAYRRAHLMNRIIRR
mgnify:FL=1